jgi:hypothetical protein
LHRKESILTTVVACIIVLSLLLPVGTARAWEQPTHSQINFEAVKLFMRRFASSDMEKYRLGRFEPRGWNQPLRGIAVESRSLLIDPWPVADRVFDAYKIGERTMEMSQWIAYGGDWADEPHLYASVRHFYDPLAMWGHHYLTDQYEFHGWYDDPQIDARTWGLDHPDNPFSFESALYYYKAALETPEVDLGSGPRLTSGHWKMDVDLAPQDPADQRSIHLALAYRALGEAMHMLGDMTQPAHVRNDSHPYDEPVEQTVTSADVRAAANLAVDAHIAPSLLSAGGTLQPPRKLFDDVARFTNEHFYSADTIYDAKARVVPANIGFGEYVAGTKKPYPAPQFEDLLVEEVPVKGWLVDRTVKRLYVPLVNDKIPLAQERLSYHWFTTVGEEMDRKLRPYQIPPSFAAEQARVLMPVAIYACADLMHHFYPTLELQADYRDLGVLEEAVEGRDAYRRQVIEVDTAMVHHQERDAAWSAYELSIAYDGPAKLVFARGPQVLKTRELHFLDGRLQKIENHEGQMVEQPLRVFLAEPGVPLTEEEAFYGAERKEGDSVYLEIEAGSRTFRSPAHAFEEEERVEVSIQPPRVLVLELVEGATEAEHTFEAVASPEGVYRFDWDFGDGGSFSEVVGAGASSQVSHTYRGLSNGDELYPGVRLYDEAGTFMAEDAVRIVVEASQGAETGPEVGGELRPSKCICSDGQPLMYDPQLVAVLDGYVTQVTGWLMSPGDESWCYYDCLEACGCDRLDTDLTCSYRCIIGE